jgi:hypothetical protein
LRRCAFLDRRRELQSLSMSAFTATRKLDPDIDSAAISGRSTSPKAGSKTPAAIESASALCPTAHPRSWHIFLICAPDGKGDRDFERIRPHQDDVAFLYGDVGPRPMVIPISACASAGASLTPSPDLVGANHMIGGAARA